MQLTCATSVQRYEVLDGCSWMMPEFGQVAVMMAPLGNKLARILAASEILSTF